MTELRNWLWNDSEAFDRFPSLYTVNGGHAASQLRTHYYSMLHRVNSDLSSGLETFVRIPFSHSLM